MNSTRFRSHVTETLIPVLHPGDIVVDNLPAHKGAGVREAIEAGGARQLYRPSQCPDLAREANEEIYDLFCDLDRRIKVFAQKIEAVFRQSESCQRIARIKGVGPKKATAIGDGAEFKNGQHLAAWVGLVLRQFSSGGAV